jgi:hypothetical protein
VLHIDDFSPFRRPTMNLKPILAAAIVAFSASALAQTPATAPAPANGAAQADREQLKADREKLKADREKMKADREKARADRRAARAAKAQAGKTTPGTTQ